MFTNWLTSEAPNKSRDFVSSSSIPDVIIEVGPPPFSRFPAHSSILSSQSGFFRAAISRASEVGKLHENLIYVPNITVEHFSPLLTYMYTGFLELTFENIFGVLLATHLLHMPRALEICRDFLAQTQRHQSDFYSSAVPVITATSSSNVIRPIASKASNIGLNFISPPKAPSSLQLPSNGTTFKSCALLQPDQQPPLKTPRLEEPLDKLIDRKSPNYHQKKSAVKPAISAQANRKASVTEHQQSQVGSESEKVVIDIASCDGPVRFRRILNEAFEKNKKQVVTPTSSSDVPSDPKYHQSNALSFHQQMVRNINEQYSKQKSISSQNSEESENSQHSGDVYTCVYCNHTFKSKYCYQKHAKRHINPLNSLIKGRDEGELSDGDVKKPSSEQASCKRDSIKPLDMNVQYYPCKTCGCKFPSYYFVHKHRKLCHPEIAADGSIQPIDNESAEGNDGTASREPTEQIVNSLT